MVQPKAITFLPELNGAWRLGAHSLKIESEGSSRCRLSGEELHVADGGQAGLGAQEAARAVPHLCTPEPWQWDPNSGQACRGGAGGGAEGPLL